MEDNLRKVNEQIHYTGQYLANKAVYQKFVKAKNKGQFRQEHPADGETEKRRYFLIVVAEKQPQDSFIKSLRLLWFQ